MTHVVLDLVLMAHCAQHEENSGIRGSIVDHPRGVGDPLLVRCGGFSINKVITSADACNQFQPLGEVVQKRRINSAEGLKQQYHGGNMVSIPFKN